ncbi:uncharacterized protein ARMOST_04648 [Armillaria ostoyae]|uniref:Uncharacterized protein n=1 Tax=Armillaria ostoyae TaxID=47428 RepID=A0A284QXY0_ARMOS|nr:uncharacterized protein ARMOST_04648 [Armillaria ostoyae]
MMEEFEPLVLRQGEPVLPSDETHPNRQ